MYDAGSGTTEVPYDMHTGIKVAMNTESLLVLTSARCKSSMHQLATASSSTAEPNAWLSEDEDHEIMKAELFDRKMELERLSRLLNYPA